MITYRPESRAAQDGNRCRRLATGRRWDWRGPAAASVLIAAAALAAGCSAGSGSGAGSGSSPVASLPGHPGNTSGAAPLTAAQSDRDFVNFTRCMRAHGVNMPDPFHRPGHQGLSLALPTLTGAARTAYQACVHIIQPVIQFKLSHGAVQVTHDLPSLTRYAQCMRAHDIAMLDPGPQGQLNLGRVAGITANFGRYSPQFRAADTACRHLLPAGVHDNGTGP